MAFATEQGKEHALGELTHRRGLAKRVGQRDNASLPAGSPMYFYCIACGGLSDVLYVATQENVW